MKRELIEKAYELAKERYAAIGVDVEEALEKLQKVQLTMLRKLTRQFQIQSKKLQRLIVPAVLLLRPLLRFRVTLQK